jgi:hypothetical protein
VGLLWIEKNATQMLRTGKSGSFFSVFLPGLRQDFGLFWPFVRNWRTCLNKKTRNSQDFLPASQICATFANENKKQRIQ